MADVYVVAAFCEVDAAADGIKRLLAADFPARNIDVLTGVPYPPEIWGLPAPRSNIRKIAALFFVIGAACGFTVASGTGWLYPLPTGAKAIISLPAYGIITYEFATIFGVFAAAIATLLEARLPTMKNLPYHPRVSEGWPTVTVRCADSQNIDGAESLLRLAGAQDVLRHAV